jgi:hypothetical protein
MPLFRHASRFPTCRYVKHKLTEDEIKHATVKFKDEGEKSKLAEAFRNKYESFDARLKSIRSVIFSYSGKMGFLTDSTNLFIKV